MTLLIDHTFFIFINTNYHVNLINCLILIILHFQLTLKEYSIYVFKQFHSYTVDFIKYEEAYIIINIIVNIIIIIKVFIVAIISIIIEVIFIIITAIIIFSTLFFLPLPIIFIIVILIIVFIVKFSIQKNVIIIS